jgi:hypothetical protein
MLAPDQISELHRLHLVEKWPLRKIARHLRIGRRTQTPRFWMLRGNLLILNAGDAVPHRCD